ncbi:hypothetical protein [Cecembia rubra]|uniref:Uncharacterized protein n=1 Tax=Cecembia rubra TaxID=1485585 RepID=A0A2P8E4Y7_9BACT|nr:hypothetical protein [Cecembia rubra]PSL04530.1 hypothetical protein CLV48_105276 [Cecembia rubra]
MLSKLILIFSICWISYHPIQALQADYLPGIDLEQNSVKVDTVLQRIDSAVIPKKSIKEKFKAERDHYHQKRQQTHKYYNPLTFIYRIIGL